MRKQNKLSLAIEQVEEGVENEEFNNVVADMYYVPEEDTLGPKESTTELENAIVDLQQATETFAVLIRAGEQLAVEGIRETDKKVLTKMVGIMSGNVASESAMDNIINFGRKIAAKIVELIKRFIEYLRNFFVGIKHFRNKVEGYKKKITDLKETQYRGDVKINGKKAPVGVYTDSTPDSFGEYAKNLEYTAKQIRAIPIAVKTVVDMLRHLQPVIENVRSGNFKLDEKEKINSIIEGTRKGLEGSVLNTLNITTVINDVVSVSPAMLGGVRFTSNIPTENDPQKPAINRLADFFSALKIHTERVDAKPDHAKDLDIPNKDQLLKTCDDLINILDTGDALKKLCDSKIMVQLKGMRVVEKVLPSKEQHLYQTQFVMGNKLIFAIARLAIQIPSTTMSIIFNVQRGGAYVIDHSLKAYAGPNLGEPNDANTKLLTA